MLLNLGLGRFTLALNLLLLLLLGGQVLFTLLQKIGRLFALTTSRATAPDEEFWGLILLQAVVWKPTVFLLLTLGLAVFSALQRFHRHSISLRLEQIQVHLLSAFMHLDGQVTD